MFEYLECIYNCQPFLKFGHMVPYGTLTTDRVPVAAAATQTTVIYHSLASTSYRLARNVRQAQK